MYDKELSAIKKSNRYRQRVIINENIVDAASNDYLGLANHKTLFTQAYEKVLQHSSHAPQGHLYWLMATV